MKFSQFSFFIDPYKRSVQINIIFLFLHEHICFGYALDAPRQGTSNEDPNHIFKWRNKKKMPILFVRSHYICTVFTIRIRTDRPEQTV